MPGQGLRSPEAAVLADLEACIRVVRRGGSPTAVLAVADRVAAMARDDPGSPVLSAARGVADAAVVVAGSSAPESITALLLSGRVLALALTAHLVGEP